MLSTAQDWRKGFGGAQSSIWQATLGMEAVAFTTHPASEDPDGSSPNYWVGYGTLPRAAQVKNVVISLYDVETREGEAYLALWSSDPDADWIPSADPGIGGGGDYDIIANGEKTIWLCELGDAEEYGDFASFRAAIQSAALVADADKLTISYDSPSQGMIEIGWQGAVLNKGVEVQLDGYGRYDNPWSQSAFPGDEISFTYGDSYLKLDFDSASREASRYIE
jgi:hypothetical protein